tara:strand:- start:382 stop:522 length:141 start_codon:yes stop_codon:yes gene_type:complete
MNEISSAAQSIGNPTFLLVERIFWLLLGVFFAFALLKAILRGFYKE